jgi:hypothetical protein
MIDFGEVFALLSLIAGLGTLLYRIWVAGFATFFSVLYNTTISELPAWAMSQGPWYANPFIFFVAAAALHAVAYLAFAVHMWTNRNWDGGIQ